MEERVALPLSVAYSSLDDEYKSSKIDVLRLTDQEPTGVCDVAGGLR